MKARNPILPLDRYCPDGEPHWISGELYVYPSWDEHPKSYCSDKLYVVHSRDLEKWSIDGPAFASSKLDWEMAPSYPPGLTESTGYEELPNYIKDYLPKFFWRLVPFRCFKNYLMWIMKKLQSKDPSKRLLYAPDSLTIRDRSYLFFCTSDDFEGVAVSDNPAGPFMNPVRITEDQTGNPIRGIDPAVFRDDDGKVYLYWGQINSCGAELTEDLTQIKEDTLVKNLLTEKEHGFHEGSSMRKIGDTYYYIFADTHRGKPTALGYATSRNPLGPFTYQGIIIDNEGCDPKSWNNHGSIECVNGQWYVFYHRSTANSRYLRRMCAEPITIDENGLIPEVRPSSIGMGEPYRIGERLFGWQACRLSQNAWIDGDRLIVKKGRAEVVFRYLDPSAQDFTSISCEGTGNAAIEYRLDGNGELTLSIETDQTIKITSFTLDFPEAARSPEKTHRTFHMDRKNTMGGEDDGS